MHRAATLDRAVSSPWHSIDSTNFSFAEIQLPVSAIIKLVTVRSVNHGIDVFQSLNIEIWTSRPSAAYMRQWIGSALVQIVACRLFGAKPLSKPTLVYCLMDHQWNFYQNTNIFIHENASENIVCEMVVILSRGRLDKLANRAYCTHRDTHTHTHIYIYIYIYIYTYTI